MVKQTQSQATKVMKAKKALIKSKQALKARNALKVKAKARNALKTKTKTKAKAKNALKTKTKTKTKAKAKAKAKNALKPKSPENPNKCFLGNQNKNFMNSMFSVMIMSLIRRTLNFTFDDCFVGAFDGMERRTASTLISMGFQQSAILLNELNETVARSHVSAGFPVHEGEDFGADKHDKLYEEDSQAWRVYKCLGWYFDTCGEIRTQRHSLLSTIRKLIFVDGSVLAFTFCRSRVSLEEYAKHKELFFKEVNAILSKRGLKIEVEYDHDYAGSFMFKRTRESHMNSFICTVRNK